MDEWTRITFLLPVTSANDRTAYLRVLDFLRSRHPPSASTVTDRSITGFSHSIDEPAAYKGFYWSVRRVEWIPDEIVVLFLDRSGRLIEVAQEARPLKAAIERFYREEGSEQEQIWCTVQQIRLV
jgi:hypothetical protein